MSETTKKRMTIIPEDNSDEKDFARSSGYRSSHRRHRSQRSKEAYKKKHPIKYFFFGSKERRLRTALSVAALLTVLIILFLYPLLFSPFTNKSASADAICADSKCDKRVSRTGDTNYCKIHSAKCQGCGCYIDAYGTYCRDCMVFHNNESDDN